MAKQIIIAEQHRVAAVFADDQIQELIVAKGTQQVSDIYVGVVENVLPSIDAAFVNIGDSDRNGFIHMGDLGPLKLKRSGGAITELLAPQQKVLVQVMKEPTGNKGPRLTGSISLPGRYLVLMPFGRGVNLSRRIASESERSRLRALAVFIKPASMGLLVRTEAEGVDEEAIIEDLEILTRQWDNVQQEAESTRPPALLNRDDDFIQRVLRDVYNADVNRIVVDSHTGLKRVKQHLSSWSGGKIPQGVLIDQHREQASILEYFRVNAAIREALKPRVDLPSGGYIVIEPTEALTVVDVNSGSFTRSATSRETVLWTNFEAATEIARQLRLRNLAGVIVVDFIDMEPRRDQLQVLEHFTKELKADKSRPQIAQLSELGLVELTRKRQGQNIYELFGRPCPTCNGLGHLMHLPGDVISEEADVAEANSVSLPGQRLSTVRSSEFRGRRAPRSQDGRTLDTRTSELRAPDARIQDSRISGGLDSRSQDLRVQDSVWSAPSRSSGPVVEEERPEVGGRSRRRRNEPLGRGDRANALSPADPADDFLTATPEPSIEEETAPSREIRGRGRRGRGAERPVEHITVEMTQDEQDVYAWLGISPLVLKDTEVADLRSAVVTVTLPGEPPPEDLQEEDADGDELLLEDLDDEGDGEADADFGDDEDGDGEDDDDGGDDSSDDVEPAPKRVLTVRRRSSPIKRSDSPELVTVAKSISVRAEAPSDLSEMRAGSEPEADEDTAAEMGDRVVRRRRRRSSAPRSAD